MTSLLYVLFTHVGIMAQNVIERRSACYSCTYAWGTSTKIRKWYAILCMLGWAPCFTELIYSWLAWPFTLLTTDSSRWNCNNKHNTSIESSKTMHQCSSEMEREKRATSHLQVSHVFVECILLACCVNRAAYQFQQ